MVDLCDATNRWQKVTKGRMRGGRGGGGGRVAFEVQILASEVGASAGALGDFGEISPQPPLDFTGGVAAAVVYMHENTVSDGNLHAAQPIHC